MIKFIETHSFFLILLAVFVYLVVSQWLKYKELRDPQVKKMHTVLEQFRLHMHLQENEQASYRAEEPENDLGTTQQSRFNTQQSQTAPSGLELAEHLQQALQHGKKIVALCHQKDVQENWPEAKQNCAVALVTSEGEYVKVGACRKAERAVHFAKELSTITGLPFETV